MNKDVPYIVFESEVTRLERTIKRLVVLVIVAVALIFASNIAWLWFFNQYEMVDVDVAQDASKNASYVGRDGTVINESEH